ncbi:reverse transcriptase domain-containing protein [Tanacetum coccineum]
MQEAVEMATELMDKKVITIAERQAEKQKEVKNTPETIKNQQQQTQRKYTGRAYTAGTGEKKPYEGSKPLCAKSHYHPPTEYGVEMTIQSANNRGAPRAPAKVYVVGHAGTNPDSNIVMGTFLLNNRYASILFDTGADRSFVSTAFSS